MVINMFLAGTEGIESGMTVWTFVSTSNILRSDLVYDRTALMVSEL